MHGPATDIFLSYKAEDRPRLVPLVEALEREGFSVWWDAHIGGGTNWQEDIERHLESAKCVIVAWSKRSIGRDGHFVRDEARRAQRRNAYLPVCLDKVEPPLGFGEIQALSLRGWKGNRADPRFLAIAAAVRSTISGEQVRYRDAVLREPQVSRRVALVGAGAGVVVAAGAGGWFLFRSAPDVARRIAVLPFSNLSNDPLQSYFAEGIAEELRAALSRIGMEVIGRTSSDAVKDMDARTAASKLNVKHLLTGSVRRSADRIRIQAQLLSGKDGVQRWGQTYDRAPDDAIKIQADIAQNVAQALSIALGKAARAALALGGTADPAAQDLVLRSRRALETSQSEADVRQSIALADAAIARDPRYADAYIAKAIAHRTLANAPIAPGEVSNELAQADAAARKAIANASAWGRAYVTMAEVQTAQLDFASALRTAKRGLTLSPDDPAVVAAAAYSVAFYENPEAGLLLADRGIALDPLRGASYLAKSATLIGVRKYRQAVQLGRQALSFMPENSWANVVIGDAYLLLGQTVEAEAEYRLVDDTAFKASRLAMLAARTGDRAKAQQLLAEMKREFGDATSFQHAEIFAQLGDPDQAFAELDAAVRRKDSGLAYLKFDAFLDPIRSDPRYHALLRTLKFP